MTNQERQDDKDGHVSFLLELEEESGPVSPRFQYRTSIRLHLAGDTPVLHYRDERVFQQGVPSKKINLQREIRREKFESFIKSLQEAGLAGSSADLVGERNRKRVGISFNAFTLVAEGAVPVRIDYLVSLLDDDTESPQKKIITLVKDFARQAAEDPEKQPP